MKQPLIGVIPLWDEKKESLWMLPGYTLCLENAGAAALILPLTLKENMLKQYVDFLDGFLFTGGHDVNPQMYGKEKNSFCAETCDARDKMEAYIFNEAVINLNKPALGICRGIQLFNVLLGGSLYQDIPSEFSGAINHRQMPPYNVPSHRVNIITDSPLHKITGINCIDVNSCHHQGINVLAEKLEVMALADDGLAEAVFMPSRHFVWAVQWHPEFYPNNEISKKIFAAFINQVQYAS